MDALSVGPFQCETRGHGHGCSESWLGLSTFDGRVKRLCFDAGSGRASVGENAVGLVVNQTSKLLASNEFREDSLSARTFDECVRRLYVDCVHVPSMTLTGVYCTLFYGDSC